MGPASRKSNYIYIKGGVEDTIESILDHSQILANWDPALQLTFKSETFQDLPRILRYGNVANLAELFYLSDRTTNGPHYRAQKVLGFRPESLIVDTQLMLDERPKREMILGQLENHKIPFYMLQVAVDFKPDSRPEEVLSCGYSGSLGRISGETIDRMFWKNPEKYQNSSLPKYER